MKTCDYYKTLGAEERPVFAQHVGGFVIPSRPDLGSFPDSYEHAVQALARSRGIELEDAVDVSMVRRYEVSRW